MTFIKCARVELSWWCDSEYTVTYWEKVVLLLTGPWGLIGCCCMWPLFIYPPICFSLTGFPLIQGHIGKSVCVCICVCLCVSMCEVCMNRFAHCICCWQSICIIRQDAVMCLPLAFASHVVCCGSVKSWDLLFRLPRENVKRPLNVSRYFWSLHDWQVPRLVAKPLKYDCNYQWSKWTTSNEPKYYLMKTKIF